MKIGTAVAGIYLIEKNGNLVELQERSYDSEARLQELLARYPSLLAGDQMETAEPRRWVLVAREMGLPSEEDGSDRWSVDHLFLDQDGVPTVVEVKRSSDSRIRREVIGQMLDYAANGVRYWPVETLRARFERTCEIQDPKQDPTKTLADAFSIEYGSEDQVAAFWSRVKSNLQAGRIRMIFVADEIPVELARVALSVKRLRPKAGKVLEQRSGNGTNRRFFRNWSDDEESVRLPSAARFSSGAGKRT